MNNEQILIQLFADLGNLHQRLIDEGLYNPGEELLIMSLVAKHEADHKGMPIEQAFYRLAGYSHARKGYQLDDLLQSMALTAQELSVLKSKYDIHNHFTADELKEIEENLS